MYCPHRRIPLQSSCRRDAVRVHEPGSPPAGAAAHARSRGHAPRICASAAAQRARQPADQFEDDVARVPGESGQLGGRDAWRAVASSRKQQASSAPSASSGPATSTGVGVPVSADRFDGWRSRPTEARAGGGSRALADRAPSRRCSASERARPISSSSNRVDFTVDSVPASAMAVPTQALSLSQPRSWRRTRCSSSSSI